MADVHCEDGTHFSTKCDPESINQVKFLPFEAHEIQTECSVTCPARKTYFQLSGLLHHIPLRQQVGFETNEPTRVREPDQENWLNFNFDWSFVPWILPKLKTAFIPFLGIILLLLLIKLATICRIFRLLSLVLVHQLLRPAQAIVLWPAGGSFGEETSLFGRRACSSGEETSRLGEGTPPFEKIFELQNHWPRPQMGGVPWPKLVGGANLVQNLY